MVVVQGERVIDEGDAAVFVVYAHGELPTAGASHDVRLHLLVVERAFEVRLLEGGNER